MDLFSLEIVLVLRGLRVLPVEELSVYPAEHLVLGLVAILWEESLDPRSIERLVKMEIVGIWRIKVLFPHEIKVGTVCIEYSWVLAPFARVDGVALQFVFNLFVYLIVHHVNEGDDVALLIAD